MVQFSPAMAFWFCVVKPIPIHLRGYYIDDVDHYKSQTYYCNILIIQNFCPFFDYNFINGKVDPETLMILSRHLIYKFFDLFIVNNVNGTASKSTTHHPAPAPSG